MTTTSSWRRRSYAAVVIALAAITATACSTQTPTNAGGPTPVTGLSGAVSGGPASANPDGTTGATPTSGRSGPATPTYPTDPRAYAEQLLAAWNAKDHGRLGQLAVTAAVQQIKDSIASGGLPDAHWHHIRCEGAAGSTYCVFRNDNGDETAIRMITSQIGHPAAVTEAPLDRTEFPASASQYVANFVAAWGAANQQRMLAYSSPPVVAFVTHDTPITSYTLGCDGAAGSSYVMVNGIGANLGVAYGFQVDNQKVSTRQRHAIVNHVDPQPVGSC